MRQLPLLRLPAGSPGPRCPRKSLVLPPRLNSKLLDRPSATSPRADLQLDRIDKRAGFRKPAGKK
eukprot:12275273-Alexandrium_andersonii.AAC.1